MTCANSGRTWQLSWRLTDIALGTESEALSLAPKMDFQTRVSTDRGAAGMGACLKYHVVGNPHYRGNVLVLQTMHNTAVLVERATKVEWVLDVWPRGYAQHATDVMTVEKWVHRILKTMTAFAKA